MNLASLSNTLLLTAFFVHIFAFLLFVVSLTGKGWRDRDPAEHQKLWGKRAFFVTSVGVALQLGYFITRWIYAGYIPNSNMFEFMNLLAIMIMLAFVVVYLIYRSPVLGMFAVPIGVIIMGYAFVFPWEVQPLIPSLNSHWLKIHVTMAAGGEAFFAVGFAAGLMYLLRTVDFNGTSKASRRARRWVEFTMFSVITVIAFIALVFVFRGMGYEATFSQQTVKLVNNEQVVSEETVVYNMPPLVKPHNSQLIEMKTFMGMDKPLFKAPSWMEGVNAGRKLNTVIWSIFGGLIAYGLLRLICRRPLGAVIQPRLKEMDPEDLDEISYRAIAIGFPVFTLGALIFAMIWAHYAWGRFWDWDPKEVWALITWLFYSAYLHLRLSKGWQGTKSSWLAVLGFLIVMFTLVGVNLVISGLHSYAGV